MVVHSLESRFREPFRKPGPIVVDYGISRIRSGGVTMDFIIRHPSQDIVYCEGKRTVCKLAAYTHQPSPWTESFRQAMEDYTQ